MADDKAPEKALYEVPVRGHMTVMKLTADEAKDLYGNDAKRIKPVKRAEPQPVGKPPYAVEPPAPGESEMPDERDEDAQPKARRTANKARSTGPDKS